MSWKKSTYMWTLCSCSTHCHHWVFPISITASVILQCNRVFTSAFPTWLWNPAGQHFFRLIFIPPKHRICCLINVRMNEWNNLMTKGYETHHSYTSCFQYASFHSWHWKFSCCCSSYYLYSCLFPSSSPTLIMPTTHSLSTLC